MNPVRNSASVVRVAVISDTHGCLRREVVGLLQDCTHILHAGDIVRENDLDELRLYGSVYAVIPPVTALLGEKTLEQKTVAFPEEGMEALHMLMVDRYPAIIAAAHGRSIYD